MIITVASAQSPLSTVANTVRSAPPPLPGTSTTDPDATGGLAPTPEVSPANARVPLAAPAPKRTVAPGAGGQPGDALPLDGVVAVVLPANARLDGPPQLRAGRVIVSATLARTACACPTCGGEMRPAGFRPQTFVIPPIAGYPARLAVRRPRHACRPCKKHTTQPLVMATAGGHRMTDRAMAMVQQASWHRPFSAVANDLGISAGLVRTVHRKAVAAAQQVPRPTPAVLGIDGVYLAGECRTMLADVEHRRVFDVLEVGERRKGAVRALTAALRRIPAKTAIQVVVMDLSFTLRNAVRAALPGARIVADKRHVLVMAINALAAVRKAHPARGLKLVVDEKPRSLAALLQKSRLTEAERRALHKVLRDHPELQQAHAAVARFRAIYACTTRRDAEAAYAVWVDNLPPELKPHFASVITEVGRWYNEIFSYFDVTPRVDNNFTEKMNDLLKRLHRSAPSSTFENLRDRFVYGRQ